jgi:cell wall-associated NlpC family hydrolase
MPIRNVTELPRRRPVSARRWPLSLLGSRGRPLDLAVKGAALGGYTLLLVAGSAFLTAKVAAASAEPAHVAAPLPAAQSSAPPAKPVEPVKKPAPSTPAAPPPPAPKLAAPPTPTPTPKAGPDPEPGLPDAAAAAIKFAMAQLGKPYIWGGAGPRGFDCSGLTMIALPHLAAGQLHSGKRVSTAQAGDLVISNGGHHVSLALGNGKVIEAPNFGQKVSIHPMPKHVVAIVRPS